MSKYNNPAAPAAQPVVQPGPPPVGALATTGQTGSTHEGGVGYLTDPKTELFRTLVTSMGSENHFYESASERDQRIRDLVVTVVDEDPDWVRRFLPFLRKEMFMRSASVMLAVEGALNLPANSPVTGRQLIAAACERADEPGEIMGYYLGRTDQRQGVPQTAPKIPMAIKRGIADGLVKNLNEYTALKYGGGSKDIHPADLIELTHPKARDDEQGALFKYLLDRRHRGTEARLDLERLPRIAKAFEIDELLRGTESRAAFFANPQEARRQLDEAGYTWERLGPRNVTEWEAIIPVMGVMALLRNLRNFDKVGIGTDAIDYVKRQLSDPDVIARSMLFPFRFWSAYKAAEGLHWGEPIEAGLQLSCRNIPELPGRTHVLTDYSSSMSHPISQRSTVQLWEVGALFACAQHARTERASFVAFGNMPYEFELPRGSILRAMERCNEVYAANGNAYYTRAARPGAGLNPVDIGHGTETMRAIHETYDDHDRIFVFSDMQCFADNRMAIWGDEPGHKTFVDQLPIPIYSFDLGGYQMAHLPAGQPNRHLLAGFSDATFKMVELLERGEDAGWPWEQ